MNFDVLSTQLQYVTMYHKSDSVCEHLCEECVMYTTYVCRGRGGSACVICDVCDVCGMCVMCV